MGSHTQARSAPSVIGMAKQPSAMRKCVGSVENTWRERRPCTAREPSLPAAAEIPAIMLA